MARDVPPFPVLLKNYPNLRNSEVVKRSIGGNVAKTIGNPQFDNTCTIRISKDLNYAGVPVPGSYPGLATMRGGDGFHYAFRVSEMRRWLTSMFGPPDIDVKGPPVSREPFKSAKGIICFDIHFSDATGHLDLWDGQTFFDEVYKLSYSGHDFFDMARRVSLWKSIGDGKLSLPSDA